MNKLVSIVIPVYNAADYLDECLASVLRQTYNDIEIILIDDGSSDSSWNLIHTWSEKDSRIIAIHQNNHGVSYTRNKGIELAKGEYIAFIDADDIISNDFISTLVDTLHKTNADCAICNIAPFKQNLIGHFSEGNTKVLCRNDALINLFGVFHGYMANKLYKTSIIKEYSIQLDEQIAISEDLLFNYEYFKHIDTATFYSGVKYLYRQHSESAFNKLDNLKWFSIIDTQNIILKKVNPNKQLFSKILADYAMTIYQAKYRVRFFDNISTDILNKITDGEKFVKLHISSLNFKQRFKISLIKYFPTIVMKYKRRKLS